MTSIENMSDDGNESENDDFMKDTSAPKIFTPTMKHDMQKMMKDKNPTYRSMLLNANRSKRNQYCADTLTEFLIKFPSTNRKKEIVTLKKTKTFINSLLEIKKPSTVAIITPSNVAIITPVPRGNVKRISKKSVTRLKEIAKEPKAKRASRASTTVKPAPKKVVKVKPPLNPDAVERRRVREAETELALQTQLDNDNDQITQSELLNTDARNLIASIPVALGIFFSYQKDQLIALVQNLIAHQHKLMAIQNPVLSDKKVTLARAISDTIKDIKSLSSFITEESWKQDGNDETVIHEDDITVSETKKRKRAWNQENTNIVKGASDSAQGLDTSLKKAVIQHRNLVKRKEIMSDNDSNHPDDIRDTPDVIEAALQTILKDIRFSVKDLIEASSYDPVAGYSFLTGPESNQYHPSAFAYGEIPLVYERLQAILSAAYPEGAFRKRKIQQTSSGNETAYDFITNTFTSPS